MRWPGGVGHAEGAIVGNAVLSPGGYEHGGARSQGVLGASCAVQHWRAGRTEWAGKLRQAGILCHPGQTLSTWFLALGRKTRENNEKTHLTTYSAVHKYLESGTISILLDLCSSMLELETVP